MTGGRETKRPAVLFFSDAAYEGGAERYLSLLGPGLDTERFDARLVIASGARLSSLAEAFAGNGLPVYETGRIGSRRGAANFRRLVGRLDPALVHINKPGPFDALYGLVAPFSRLAGARHVVSTEHLPMVRPFAKSRLLRRFADPFVERVLTVSEDNRGHLARLHGVDPARVRVVHIGIPDPGSSASTAFPVETGVPPGTFVALAVGALEERKGHRFAIDAISRLRSNAHLAIAGAGEERSRLAARAAAGGIEERVHLLGHRRDVPALLAAAGCLVLSSTLEATPYVVVEAMAAGVPVVASDVYGLPELVEDGKTGILVPPGDPSALAAAIDALATDPERRGCMGAAARRRYEERFTLERHVRAVVSVYDEVLGGGKEETCVS